MQYYIVYNSYLLVAFFFLDLDLVCEGDLDDIFTFCPLCDDELLLRECFLFFPPFLKLMRFILVYYYLIIMLYLLSN
jgi:hypothetical protein